MSFFSCILFYYSLEYLVGGNMELFNNVKEIENAYNIWDISVEGFIEDLEDAQRFVRSNIQEMREFVREGIIQLGKDYAVYLQTLVLSPFDEDVTRPEALLGDIQFLKIQIGYARKSISFQKEILNSMTEDNYEETARLSDFCWDYYFMLEQQLQNRQVATYHNIDCGFADAIDFSTLEDIDNSFPLFSEFYQKQLSSIKNPKKIEKVKKM